MSELFFEPKTTQYGSHMVMSNVNKISKKKFMFLKNLKNFLTSNFIFMSIHI